MSRETELRVYFGHHKCATSWVNTIIQLVCRDLNLKFSNVSNPKTFEGKLDIFTKENRLDFLSYTNANIKFVRDLKNFIGFHIIRDPRDVVVSAYFSHLYSHSSKGWEELNSHREKLQKVPQNEGLYLEMDARAAEFADMYNWDYDQQNVVELKMENLIDSPYETIVSAFSHLKLVEEEPSFKKRFTYLMATAVNNLHYKSGGISLLSFNGQRIPVDVLLGYLYKNRFSKVTSGRKRGEEDPKSHYRKGVAGDWKNYFDEDHCRYFKETYNDLLVKLKYEKDSAW